MNRGIHLKPSHLGQFIQGISGISINILKPEIMDDFMSNNPISGRFFYKKNMFSSLSIT